ILFFGGIQLVALGIIGEYLGRTFDETKGRPLYFINRYVPSLPEGARRGADTGAERRERSTERRRHAEETEQPWM
ncbi:MAG: glycosyltransferase, partial [Sulfurifustaceae bacterium]